MKQQQQKRGVLVVGHGSRRQEANDDVREAARRIGERGRFPLIEAAFLEIEAPDIAAGFARLVGRGATEITVHPYFLSPGRHTRGDIPVEVQAAAARYPYVITRISEPLSAHDLVIDASIQRILEAEGRPPSSARTNEGGAVSHEHNGCRAGTVYLVGAGPGDPGLLTIKAGDLLASCDVVIYDYLVNPEILRRVPLEAERIYVGKVGGGRQTPQEEINRLLVAAARKNKRVVRLKGGDPFIFGRGAEEAEVLRAHHVPFEVVPGISSALAVPAYAGIPLTHRALASSFAVVTGARANDDSRSDENLASLATADTLVILMGASSLRETSRKLIAAGRAAHTPAAVIRWGTYDGQHTVAGTLDDIAERAEAAGLLRPPAVIVIGETVRLRERLAWFEPNGAAANEPHALVSIPQELAV